MADSHHRWELAHPHPMLVIGVGKGGGVQAPLVQAVNQLVDPVVFGQQPCAVDAENLRRAVQPPDESASLLSERLAVNAAGLILHDQSCPGGLGLLPPRRVAHIKPGRGAAFGPCPTNAQHHPAQIETHQSNPSLVHLR